MFTETTVVDTTAWDLHEEDASGALYPVGRLSKYLLRYNDDLYLLKETWVNRTAGSQDEERIAHQFWSEIIAAKIGKIIGVPVPETFIAVNHNPKIPFNVGVLTKWFVDIETESAERGSDFLNKNIDDYKEEKHNLKSILDNTNHIDKNVEYWFKTMIFDALIANADRHHENWEIINNERFSPCFDNGISLCWRQTEATFPSFNHQRYFNKFKYKMKIDLSSENTGYAKISEVVSYFDDIYNIDIRECRNHLITDLEALGDKLSQFLIDIKHTAHNKLQEKDRLSNERSDFVLDFVKKRKSFILELL